eukprot:3940852-Rhodomonas_salina.2
MRRARTLESTTSAAYNGTRRPCGTELAYGAMHVRYEFAYGAMRCAVLSSRMMVPGSCSIGVTSRSPSTGTTPVLKRMLVRDVRVWCYANRRLVARVHGSEAAQLVAALRVIKTNGAATAYATSYATAYATPYDRSYCISYATAYA